MAKGMLSLLGMGDGTEVGAAGLDLSVGVPDKSRPYSPWKDQCVV